jgi:hypothetical protein
VRLVLDGSEHADTLSQIQGCQNQHPTLDRQHGIRVPGRPASVKKSIYGPIDLREILLGCNRRYLAHLSALNDFSAGIRALDRLTRPRNVEGKAVKGINFFEPGDSALLQALQNPRVNIAGIRRADLLPDLGMFSSTRLSRQLRRLLDIGVIKRVVGTYRYYQPTLLSGSGVMALEV